MLSKTYDDLDPWHAFIGEEFDDVAMFNFHVLTLSPVDPLLPAKSARRPISTSVLFAHRNCGCSDHFYVTHLVNGQTLKESPGHH
jgi:hypothetical protein